MSFVSYVEYLVYIGIIFGAGFVVGFFWNRVMGARDNV